MSYSPKVRGERIAARKSCRDLDLSHNFQTNIKATERIAFLSLIDLEEPPSTNSLLFPARQLAATYPP